MSEIHPAAAGGFAPGGRASTSARRPGYPEEAVAWIAERLGIGPGSDVLDLAAGTGKLTRALAPARRARGRGRADRRDARAALAALPDVEAFDGTAEAIPLPDASVDAVTAAQAFHWFRRTRRCERCTACCGREAALALVWNIRDLSDPLQARIQEILAPHGVEVRSHRNIEPTELLGGDLFGPVETRSWPYVQRLSRAHLVDRIASTSYIAILDPDARAEVLSRVLEAADGLPEPISIPYTTDVYAADRM